MLKTELVKIRTKIDFTKPYYLYCDNSRKFYDNLVGNALIWDDVNSVCYSVRLNNEPNNDRRPLEVDAFAYDIIQYISQIDTRESVAETLDSFVIDTLITPEQLALIKTRLNITA